MLQVKVFRHMERFRTTCSKKQAKAAQEPSSDKQTDGFPARCDTAAPQPAVLESVHVCPCEETAADRWHVILSSSALAGPLTCSVTSHCSAEAHSPEKFLETSMVVRMAPCGSQQPGVKCARSHAHSQTTSNQELESAGIYGPNAPLFVQLHDCQKTHF